MLFGSYPSSSSSSSSSSSDGESSSSTTMGGGFWDKRLAPIQDFQGVLWSLLVDDDDDERSLVLSRLIKMDVKRRIVGGGERESQTTFYFNARLLP